MRHLCYLYVAMFFFAGAILCEAAPKKSAAEREKNAAELRQLFQTCFPRWDRDRDKILSLGEINALIENPQVRGDEAAAVVAIRRSLVPKGEEDSFQGLSATQLFDAAGNPEVVKPFSQLRQQIRSINRALFLPGDPNLASFHQGRLGDCYLLSVIGAFAYRSPQAVRAMIKPAVGGGYEVHFGSGKMVKVPPVTDAELVLGARMGADRGIWLCVLEKAYASVREEKRETKEGSDVEEDDAVTKDLLGGGRCGPVISMLTGHATARAPIARWAREDARQAADRLHDLLIPLSRERRLMAAGTGKNPDKQRPKHIPGGHAFGVLGYDPNRRIVSVFNPWGNDVTPSGPPGLVNGYVTRDGIFGVPIQEFVQTFGALVYETDKPIGN
jgi:hypothetical protein